MSLGRFAIALGTGSYLVGAGASYHLVDWRSGPLVSVTTVAIARGPLAWAVNPLERGAASEFDGFGVNALVGWDLPLGDRFTARGGVGYAYNPQYQGKTGKDARAPLTFELTLGPTF